LSKRARRLLAVLSVLALATTAALQITSGFAQTPVTWTAGPGTSGSGSGLVLRTTSGDSPVAAPATVTDASGASRTATVMPPAGGGDTYRYLYYDVDPSSFPAGFTFARVDVEYLDETSYAGVQIGLQYDATTNAFADGGVQLAIGSGLFQTATFHLSNVRFDTSQNNGLSDFRVIDRSNKGIKVTRVIVTGSTTSTRPSAAGSLTFDLSKKPASNGLTIKPAGDGVSTVVNANGRNAVQVSPEGNVYVDVDDTYMASNNEAMVEVSYFDKGFGFFYINYDATSGFKDSFGPSTDYLVNNVVYLQNSQTWKTYKFSLGNVKFANGLLGGQADFKIIQPQGNGTLYYDLANAGYDLLVDKITLTKFTTPIDETGTFEGNYSGFGPPAFVWTQLGSVSGQNDTGHGLFQDEAQGPTTVATVGGKAARRASSGAIFLNVNDNYIKNGADSAGVKLAHVVVGVEYFDEGTGSFAVDYDSSTGGVKTADSVALTNSNSWKRVTVYLVDARFNNAISGGNDLAIRVTAGPSTLAVRDIVVSRTLGEHRTGAIPTGFSPTQRVVGSHYFPVFDGYRPTLWEGSTLAPAGTGADSYVNDVRAQNTVNTSYSYRSIATQKKDLGDMADAGIDFTLLWFSGNLLDLNTQAVAAVKQSTAAYAQLATEGKTPPKFGLLLDPVHNRPDPFLRTRAADGSFARLDLNDPGTRGAFIKVAEDYFSLVPRSMWATINGRPIIAVYYQGNDQVLADQLSARSLMEQLTTHFQETHGVTPYLIVDRLYDPDSSRNLPVDDYFSWGAGHCETCDAAPGFAQRSVFEVGPGFKDLLGRERGRENGAFYTRSWDRAIAKGNHMVLIDTFNYFVEGAAISETREYGRTYLNITRDKAAVFKASNFTTATCVKASLGAGSGVSCPNAGAMQDDVPSDALTEGGPNGGRRSKGIQMYFSVDDGFQVSNAAEVDITVEYFDRGVNIIDVKYDSTTGEKTAGRIVVRDSNSGTFKTQTFRVPDAFFGNRLLYANDLRLDTDIAGGMEIKSVTITRVGATVPTPTPTQVPSVCADTPSGGTASPAPTPVPGGLRTYLPLIYRNACGS
jgi:hypothetical protein